MSGKRKAEEQESPAGRMHQQVQMWREKLDGKTAYDLEGEI